MSGVRIAFPSLGLLSLVAEQFLRALGMDVITPPPWSRRTLDIGVQESADGLCIPCKLLYGNYVEAAERGANEIIMPGGPGRCRLGYSARQQVEQLARRGLPVRAHTLDLYHIHRDLFRLTRELTEGRPVTELVEPIRFLLALLALIDRLETAALETRPREAERGVPVLNLSFDEQTGRAGMMTRLEAFVDMLWAAKRRREW